MCTSSMMKQVLDRGNRRRLLYDTIDVYMQLLEHAVGLTNSIYAMATEQ